MVSSRVRPTYKDQVAKRVTAYVISSDRSTSAFMSDINRVIPPITHEQVE